MLLRKALLTATILALPAAAMAQPVDGLYIGGGAGYNYLNQVKGKNIVIANPPGTVAVSRNIVNAQFAGNSGFVGLASVGYGFGFGLRVELEGDFRQTSVHLRNNSGNTFTRLNGGGQIQQYGPMVNALYDFDAGLGWIFPYVGVGAGYQEVKLRNGHIFTVGLPDQESINFTNSAKGSFAYQGIIGAAYPIDAVPGLSVTTEARFIGTTSQQRYNGSTTFRSGATAPGTSVKLASLTNESFLVGLRYAFYTPAPPPPAPAPVAVPAPAPARTYLVFFDWDRYELTDRARQIVAEAAQASTRVQTTRIEVNGYTDTSGSKAYNQKLSVRRAETVAAELVKDGVAKNEIEIHGFGQTHLLVPTADGVREPQNRRVEIILK